MLRAPDAARALPRAPEDKDLTILNGSRAACRPRPAREYSMSKIQVKNPVVGLVTFLNRKIVVFQVNVEIRQNQFVFNEVPDDLGSET